MLFVEVLSAFYLFTDLSSVYPNRGSSRFGRDEQFRANDLQSLEGNYFQMTIKLL